MFPAELTVRDAGRMAVISLRGELDAASTPEASVNLIAAASCIVVDLAAVEYLDFSALCVLVQVRKWTREHGGDLALAAPQQQARQLLRATGLIDAFAVYRSAELAAAGLGPAGTPAPAPPPAPAAGRRGRRLPAAVS